MVVRAEGLLLELGHHYPGYGGVVEHVVRGGKFVQADFSRHEIVEVHSSPSIQVQVDRDVAGEVGGAEVHALDPDLIQDSGDDGDLDGGQGVCDSDEVEHVVGADAGDLPDCSDGIGGARVDGVGGPEAAGLPQLLIIDVNHDDLPSSGDRGTADGVQADTARTDYHDRFACAHVCGV